jgi:lysozyme family protein
MLSVRQIAEEIVAREGGYVNDRDDPGGATNHGVTIGTMKALGIDVDRDGDIDVTDVKLLTRAQAVDIYVKHYFEKPRIAELPEELHATVFDMQVNAGSNAVRILQHVLTTLGFRCDVDGTIGPATILAANSAVQAKGGLFVADTYGIARREYYYAIGDRRSASRKYARRKDGGKGGWITRAEEFISPKLHLTDAQHRTRVAKWG